MVFEVLTSFPHLNGSIPRWSDHQTLGLIHHDYVWYYVLVAWRWLVWSPPWHVITGVGGCPGFVVCFHNNFCSIYHSRTVWEKAYQWEKIWAITNIYKSKTETNKQYTLIKNAVRLMIDSDSTILIILSSPELTESYQTGIRLVVADGNKLSNAAPFHFAQYCDE